MKTKIKNFLRAEYSVQVIILLIVAIYKGLPDDAKQTWIDKIQKTLTAKPELHLVWLQIAEMTGLQPPEPREMTIQSGPAVVALGNVPMMYVEWFLGGEFNLIQYLHHEDDKSVFQNIVNLFETGCLNRGKWKYAVFNTLNGRTKRKDGETNVVLSIVSDLSQIPYWQDAPSAELHFFGWIFDTPKWAALSEALDLKSLIERRYSRILANDFNPGNAPLPAEGESVILTPAQCNAYVAVSQKVLGFIEEALSAVTV